MSERWVGSLISNTAPTTSGGGAGDSAPGVWTLDQAAPYIANKTWPGTGTPDPQFQYVTALLHGDGTNATQNNTFLDSSPNNFYITRNGNTTQGSFSPYGTLWSNYFEGSSSYFYINNTSSLYLSTDFTIEMWVYPTDVSAQRPLVQYRNGGNWTSGDFQLWINPGGYIFWDVPTGSSYQFTTPNAVAVGTWNHIAVTRQSGTIRAYINGIYQTSVSDSTTFNGDTGTKKFFYNFDGSSSKYFAGYASNLRMNSTTALYTGTSNFTPPTSPLTAVSGTCLLTCQSNRFIDNSSNAFTLNLSGSPQVQRFSPFQNLATYQTAKIGGSGYFDGSSYLNASANSTQFGYGSAYTIEGWIYSTSSSQNGKILTIGGSSWSWSSTGLQYVLYQNGSTLQFDYYVGTGTPNSLTPTMPSSNAWHHVAIGFNGTTTRMWVDGVSVASTTTAYSSVTVTNFSVGGQTTSNPGNYWNGYLTDVRFVKNTDVYGVSNTTITVPTAPLNAITNTQLLNSFTNGAIYDNAEMNDLQTVSNAQISTSTYKYGTGSMYFDGSSGLTVPYVPQVMQLPNSNFTIECWVYLTAYPSSGDYAIIWQQGKSANSTFGGAAFYVWNNSGSYRLQAELATANNNSSTYYSSNLSFSLNTWYHVAVSKAGGSLQFFFNGNNVGTSSVSATGWFNNTSAAGIGATYDNAVHHLTGYIDDLRITNGYARYWSNFLPPSAPYPNYGGTLQLTYDPQFNYTTLLLSGDGTNGAQNNTFLDSSSNAFTITRNGNTTQGTFSPYGSFWSNYFGGSGNYYIVSNSTACNESGDYTHEFWAYPVQNSQSFKVILNKNITGYYYTAIYLDNWTVNQHNVNTPITGPAVAYNTWTHIAQVRSGTTVTLYVNGTAVGTATQSSTVSGSANLVFCTDGNNPGGGSNYYTGYISNYRFTASALYTSNFTPTTTPLTALSGTQLLCAQSNRFIDNSSNNLTFTITGSPSVQRFSPFNPTAPYSTTTIGGSGYFGSGNYLSASSSATFSGNFTFECWFQLTTTSGEFDFMNIGDSYLSSGLEFYSYNGSIRVATNNATVLNVSSSLAAGAWYHVAAVRSGSTVTVYLNGSSIGTFSNSATLSGNVYIGAQFYNGTVYTYNNGYLSDVRLNNTTVYTTNFTLPTAPETAISGTQLLCNFTNAGIIDSAEMNDLQTVGSAQISTSVYKYGTGSMYFNGSGSGLQPANQQIFTFGTGSFTIEFWLYLNTSSQSCAVYDSRPASTTGYYPTIRVNSGVLYYYTNGSTQITGSTLAASTWYHVAVSKSSGTTYMFVNGNLVGTYSDTNTYLNGTNRPLIGADGYDNFSGSNYLNGYLDDLRITNGYARYVQNFTPPTAALPNY